MKKKKYYNGHNQRKKNKNIVLVYPTSLLVHHRLSSMITKSMIYFYFSRGTIIFYFSYLHFSVSNVSYFSFCFELFVIFERVSRRLYRLETAVRKKKCTLLFCNPSIRPENQQQIWSYSAMDTWHITRVRKGPAMQIFNEYYVATDLQGIIMTFCRIY